MAYRIKIMPRAERDLAEIYERIGVRSSLGAQRWYVGLRDAIRGLRGNPKVWPVTPEDRGLRHLLYGNKPHVYRVIYRVVDAGKIVEVLHVRHGARNKFIGPDISVN